MIDHGFSLKKKLEKALADGQKAFNLPTDQLHERIKSMEVVVESFADAGQKLTDCTRDPFAIKVIRDQLGSFFRHGHHTLIPSPGSKQITLFEIFCEQSDGVDEFRVFPWKNADDSLRDRWRKLNEVSNCQIE